MHPRVALERVLRVQAAEHPRSACTRSEGREGSLAEAGRHMVGRYRAWTGAHRPLTQKGSTRRGRP